MTKLIDFDFNDDETKCIFTISDNNVNVTYCENCISTIDKLLSECTNLIDYNCVDTGIEFNYNDGSDDCIVMFEIDEGQIDIILFA